MILRQVNEAEVEEGGEEEADECTCAVVVVSHLDEDLLQQSVSRNKSVMSVMRVPAMNWCDVCCRV